MTPRIYLYAGCDTCRRAVRWLAAKNIPHETIAIREQPPTVAELRQMLAAVGDLRRLFNTSGQDYRALGMKDRLPTLSTDDALALLAANGNLVKRPFALTATSGTTGFNETEWEKLFAR